MFHSDPSVEQSTDDAIGKLTEAFIGVPDNGTLAERIYRPRECHAVLADIG